MNSTPLLKTMPSYAEVRKVYPTLRTLEAEAEAYQSSAAARFCANAAWYDRPRWGRSLRDRVIAVADRAALRYGQQRVYDLVYDAIYCRLPDCRGGCGWFDV